MAAEKKSAMATEYLVLSLIKKTPANSGGAVSSMAPVPANTWTVVRSVSATSATAAVRACVSELAEKDQAGTFVAVPARSWKPVTVNPQTTIRLELTEAKT